VILNGAAKQRPFWFVFYVENQEKAELSYR